MRGCIEVFDKLVTNQTTSEKAATRYFRDGPGSREAWIGYFRHTLASALDKESKAGQMIGVRLAICGEIRSVSMADAFYAERLTDDDRKIVVAEVFKPTTYEDKRREFVHVRCLALMSLAILRSVSDTLWNDARSGDYMEMYRFWCDQWHRHMFGLVVANARGQQYDFAPFIAVIKQQCDELLSRVGKGELLRFDPEKMKEILGNS